jgi:hypothetical protein
MMTDSLQNLKKVSSELLEQRLETVRELSRSETELYEIAKDRLTGEHYLHYSYLHRNLADTGAEEVFHQLLPLETDDVLAVLFGEQPYKYPHHWHKPFLRNGPEGFYVWFDPGYLDEHQQSEEIGKQLKAKLQQFKARGKIDEEAVRKLLEELDRTRNQE